MNNFCAFYKRYEHYILYIIFGVLTTIVNFVVFGTLIKFIDNLLIVNTLAFVVAVLFAYFTNNKYVFKEEKEKNLKEKINKIIKFYSTRITTFIIETAILYILVFIGLKDIVAKILVAIIVIILNYLLSKWIVFSTK